MSTIAELTREAMKSTETLRVLKAAESDEAFISSLIQFAETVGFSVTEDDIKKQMVVDRELAKTMGEDEFESVAGSMLGARMSGGHQSGSNC
ncbi:hypothetical protein BCF46_0961 [Litoreibacter meonggei]|uniref:Uncharacterized protein n=1 Tax=Litoreibacter meonggei TaxID=1049199 RepID=A0A497X678_9RHOB|nr:hypothetical protein [Litoreibacter meonggei]RLJ60755.1 hypothetical protein BCF46_0961 [Litoreibacter meonggei]